MKAFFRSFSRSKSTVYYSLSIADPCSENWDNMSKTEQGRFCASCQKQVLDFSGLSDAQVIETIRKTSGEICGRLGGSQMNRELTIARQINKNTPFYKRIAAAFLMLGLFESQNSAASVDKDLKQVISPALSKTAPDFDRGKNGLGKDSLKNVIEGVVRDLKTKQVIPYAIIHIRDTRYGTSTDEDGHFILVLPEGPSKDSIHLKITYASYKAFERRFSYAELPVHAEFMLQPLEQNSGAVFIQDSIVAGRMQVIVSPK